MRNAIPRVRNGPAPDRNALRRDRDKAEWFHLPAEGRAGDPPEWPFTRQSSREIAHWQRLWALPQAVAWEANRLLDAVASYVRALAIAEMRSAKAADRTLARQYQDTLGLTDAGMRANRWHIGPEQAQRVTRANDANRTSAKARFQVINGEAAG